MRDVQQNCSHHETSNDIVLQFVINALKLTTDNNIVKLYPKYYN